MNRYLFKNLVDPQGRVKEVEVAAWTPLDAVRVVILMCKDLKSINGRVEVYCDAQNVSLN